MLGVLLTAGGAAYAMTNSITMPAEVSLGYGANSPVAFTLSNVQYLLSRNNPQVVTTVSFDVVLSGGGAGAAPQTVSASLDGGNTWYSCGPHSGGWACTLNVNVSSIDSGGQLEVAAFQ